MFPPVCAFSLGCVLWLMQLLCSCEIPGICFNISRRLTKVAKFSPCEDKTVVLSVNNVYMYRYSRTIKILPSSGAMVGAE